MCLMWIKPATGEIFLKLHRILWKIFIVRGFLIIFCPPLQGGYFPKLIQKLDPQIPPDGRIFRQGDAPPPYSFLVFFQITSILDNNRITAEQLYNFDSFILVKKRWIINKNWCKSMLQKNIFGFL